MALNTSNSRLTMRFPAMPTRKPEQGDKEEPRIHGRNTKANSPFGRR
jgi:hypothetical protein